MSALPLYELSFLGISDPGIPNLERVVFRVAAPTDLSQYGLILGWQNEDGSVVPLSDILLWFGNVKVEPGSWVLVYTAEGEYKASTVPDSGDVVHSFHWGSKTTYFNIPQVVPVLFTIGRTQICRPQPQLAFGSNKPTLTSDTQQ